MDIEKSKLIAREATQQISREAKVFLQEQTAKLATIEQAREQIADIKAIYEIAGYFDDQVVVKDMLYQLKVSWKIIVEESSTASYQPEEVGFFMQKIYEIYQLIEKEKDSAQLEQKSVNIPKIEKIDIRDAVDIMTQQKRERRLAKKQKNFTLLQDADRLYRQYPGMVELIRS